MREINKDEVLAAIRNYERFFSAPKFNPQNEYRRRLGLPEITKEQIIIERNIQIKEFQERLYERTSI